MRRRAFDWEDDFSEEKRDRKERIRREEFEKESQEKESKLLDAVDGLGSALADYLSLGGADSGLFESVGKMKAAIRDEIMGGYMAGGEDADGSELRKALHLASAAYKLAEYLSDIRIDVDGLRAIEDKLSRGDYSGLGRNIADVSKDIVSDAGRLEAALRLTGKDAVSKWVGDVSAFLPGAESIGRVFGDVNSALLDEKGRRENLLKAMRACLKAL